MCTKRDKIKVIYKKENKKMTYLRKQSSVAELPSADEDGQTRTQQRKTSQYDTTEKENSKEMEGNTETRGKEL